MSHILHTRTVHKTASLADEGNAVYCQSSGANSNDQLAFLAFILVCSKLIVSPDCLSILVYAGYIELVYISLPICYSYLQGHFIRGAYLIIDSLRGRLFEGSANSREALIKKKEINQCHVLRNVYIYIRLHSEAKCRLLHLDGIGSSTSTRSCPY